MVRDEGDHLNTHFRAFQAPMGMALGRRPAGHRHQIQVWEFVDVPAVAARLDPPGRHDACFLPRSSHVTGNIQIHEMAWGAGGELWVVNTRFSCLCTLDRSASFAPRWRPPFVSALEPTDRCHLNGLGMVDGRPRYVTALGETDEPAGWRANKANGRHPDGRGLGRGDHPRPVDAPLAALVRRPAVGLRVGRGDARLRRPEHRQVRADRRGAGLHARARLRRRSRLRRAVAGARERRLQRHPDHRAAHRRRADLRRLRDRPEERSGGRAAAVRDRRAGGLRRDGAAGPAVPGPDQRRRKFAGELLRGPQCGAGRHVRRAARRP